MKRLAALLIVATLFAAGLFAGDEYDARKRSLATSPAEKVDLTVENDSIGIMLDSETGQFMAGKQPGDITIIYDYPNPFYTSQTCLAIDNDDTPEYVTDGPFTTFATPFSTAATTTYPFAVYPASGDSSYIEGGYEVDGIRFMQRITPVYLERPDGRLAGSCFIEYRITNLDIVTHPVFVRLMIDTKVDDNDQAPLATVYGYSDVDNIWYGDSVPTIWSAYADELPGGTPDTTGIKATGYLKPDTVAVGATPANAFAVGNWWEFSGYTNWYYTPGGTPYDDSGVFIWWGDTLAPGDSVTFATYYGVGLPDFTPPDAESVFPAPGTWTSCENTDVITLISDEETVVGSSIEFQVNSEIFDTSDSELEWNPLDSTLTYTPPTPFGNGDTVVVSLNRAEDLVGNNLADTLRWEFYVDIAGPEVTDMDPNGVTVTTLSPMLSCSLVDYESGVDTTTLEISLNGTPYDLSTPGMTYDPATGRLDFALPAAGISFPPATHVDVVVSAEDMVDTCGTNSVLPHDWWFSTSMPGDPELLMPPESVITTCEDQEIWIDLTAGSGPDTSTITLWINGDSFGITDEELSLENDTLYFRPSGYYTYNTGDVLVCLDEFADTFGIPTDSACWFFRVDLQPPLMSSPSPVSPPEVVRIGDISMDISDGMLPVDSASIEVTVISDGDRDTTVVDFGDPAADWSNPTFSFISSQIGADFTDNDEVKVRLRVRDLPPAESGCPGNLLDTSFVFILSETRCERLPNPITPGVSIGKNDVVEFEYPNMRKAGREVIIYIYDLRNNLLAELDSPSGGSWSWDGRDTAGNLVPQGTYIYLIRADGEKLCSGTLTVAR